MGNKMNEQMQDLANKISVSVDKDNNPIISVASDEDINAEDDENADNTTNTPSEEVRKSIRNLANQCSEDDDYVSGPKICKVILDAIETLSQTKEGQNQNETLWVQDRIEQPLNILWVGCKHIESVILLHFSLKNIYPGLKIKIVVIEDIKPIAIPEDYAYLQDDIDIIRTDFMYFESVGFFEIMYISVKQSLSNCLKLKFFCFAFQHHRSQQPMILVGIHSAFRVVEEDSDAPPGAKVVSKEGKKNNARTIKKLAAAAQECGKTRVSLLITDCDFWGTLLSRDPRDCGVNLLAQFKHNLVLQLTRLWSPQSTDCTRLLPAAYHNSKEREVTKDHLYCDIRLNFLSRTLHLQFSKGLLEKAIEAGKTMQKTKIIHEIYQAIYYQVN